MSTVPPTNNSGLNLLREMPKRLADLIKQHSEQRLRITRGPQLRLGATTDENAAAYQRVTQELAKLTETTLASIVGLRDEAAKWASAAASDIVRRMGRPTPIDSTEALLRETREQRAWARIRPLLDLIEPVALNGAVAEHALQAIANGDDDTLFALRTEMPAYAQAKGVAELVAVILSALDDTIAKARPEISAALTERRELERGMQRLHTGFTYAEHAVNKSELSAVIPSWDSKQPDHIVQAEPVDNPI